MSLRAVPLLSALALGCAPVLVSAPDAGPDVADSGSEGADGGGEVPDASEPLDPNVLLEPRAGELTVHQLHLPAGFLPKPGESAIVVGPDGTLVLINLGNSNHAELVRDTVRRLNTELLVPARGFRARRPLEVDWLVLTHVHGDHVGGFEKLLLRDEPLEVTAGIVHRGLVELGPALNESSFEELCRALGGPLGDLDRPLCRTGSRPGCNFSQLGGTFPATDCPGLLVGDLSDASDDGLRRPTFLPLGGGARLVLTAANAHVSTGDAVVPAAAFGHADDNEENARSLAGVLEHGAFRYHFGGDLTGAGTSGVPDVESHYAGAAAAFYGAAGVDVVHAHHHARKTSSNRALVELLAPPDGRARNVIGGVNEFYVGSPHQEVLDAWLADGRLADGWFWVTARAPAAGSHARLVDAAGDVLVQTTDSGAGYVVQAAGATRILRQYPSVRVAP